MIGNSLMYGTAAMQWAAAKANGRRGGLRSARKRRRKAKASRTITPRRTRAKRARARRGARLVKGSAAAKRYMAKIRRMRKRK